MKFKFLALTMCLWTLSSLSLQAANLKSKQGASYPKMDNRAKVQSKHKASPNFFGASSAVGIPLIGITPQVFVPLTFELHEHSHGKTIKAENGSQFWLDKGTYLVLFSGTFVVIAPQNPVLSEFQDVAAYNVALQLGSNVIFTNTDSADAEDSSTASSAITKVIEVTEPTKLSVVASATVPGAYVNASSRSITILQLK